MAFLATRASNWLFGRLTSDRTAAWLSFGLWAGLAVLAMAGKVAPVRLGLLVGVTPLVIWLVIDLARAGKRECPRCGRRIKRGLLSCPKCGRDLDTEARVEE